MGLIKGQREYQRWKKGKKLTRTQAILANCFICNGFEDSKCACLGGGSCPLYAFGPYR